MSIATTEPTTNGVVPVANIPQQRLVATDESQFCNLLDTARFEHLQRLARLFSESDLVPEQFKGKVANCFIGLQMALRLGIDPLMFLQSCYVVHGRPGIESKLAIALANTCGALKDGIHYDVTGTGNAMQCEAWAIHKSGERISAVCTMKMAADEGWLNKSGSKWKTLPELMLKYRAAMFLIRTHIPESILGMQSKEEMQDVERVTVRPQVKAMQAPSNSLDALAETITGQTVTLENQDAEPADNWHEHFAEFCDAINKATTVPQVSDLYRDWLKKSNWTRSQEGDMHDAVEHRKEQIKSGK